MAAVLTAPAVLSGDAPYWHIAAGRWMIDNQQILRINLFAYSAAGDSWLNQDWLSELLFAGAYVGGGWSGMLVLAALAAATAAGIFAFFLARGRSAAMTGVWFLLALLAGAGSVKALPYLLALPCLAVWAGCLARAGEKAPPLKLLPVMLLWANISTSFIVGLALTLALAIEAIFQAKENRLEVARRWAVFAGFALIFALITPTGAFGLVQGIRAFRPAGGIETVLPLILLLPAGAMLLPRRWIRLLFLAGLFLLSLTSASARLSLAVIAPLLAAGKSEDAPAGLKLRAVFALVLVAIVGSGVRILMPLEPGDDRFTPKSALAAVPAGVKRGPVFNERAFGGYLIFRDVRPFIDGRPLYGAAFRHRAADPSLLAQTLTRYHVRWTILKPDNPAVKTLDGMAGWSRTYTDQWAVVHVKAAPSQTRVR